MTERGRRKLAAIMFTDIVGYSSIMQEDEKLGRTLRQRHRQIFEDCTLRHEGQIIQYFGDGTLSIFGSAVSAVECAVCMQKALLIDPQVPVRIGIHLGDIHHDESAAPVGAVFDEGQGQPPADGIRGGQAGGRLGDQVRKADDPLDLGRAGLDADPAGCQRQRREQFRDG